MLVKVLKGFPYAEDGIHTRDLVAGAVEDIRADLIHGLREEGYVGDVETITAAPSAGDDASAAPGPAEDQPKAAEPDGDQAPVSDAFDHDGDGKPGGSLPKARRGKAK